MGFVTRIFDYESFIYRYFSYRTIPEDRLKAEVEEAEQRARDLVMKKEMKKREKDVILSNY